MDAAEPLNRIKEPRLAADDQVEAAVAVGDDVKSGGLLRVDDRRDGVEILLAEQRVAQCSLERPAVEAAVEPQRARVGPGDRRRQHHVAGGFQHRPSPEELFTAKVAEVSQRTRRRSIPSRPLSLHCVLCGEWFISIQSKIASGNNAETT